MADIDDQIAALEAALAPLKQQKAAEAMTLKQEALNKLDALHQTIIAAFTEAGAIAKQYRLEFEVVVAKPQGWGEATGIKLDGYGNWTVYGERSEAWESSSMNC